ncbi:MAG TPA: helix-turn-helix domain-containing protein [Chthoniobacterales bacterium]
MLETIGTRLRQGRLERGWEIDQVAEMTKIRPDRILDLEADDYSRFPNLTYAKSFLAKYAKFLGVDLREELEQFHVSRGISLSDYQYLRSAPVRYMAESRPVTPKVFRVPPVLVTLLVLVVLVGLPVFAYLAVGLSRLQPRTEPERVSEPVAVATPAAAAAEPPDTLQSILKEVGAAPSPAASSPAAPSPSAGVGVGELAASKGASTPATVAPLPVVASPSPAPSVPVVAATPAIPAAEPAKTVPWSDPLPTPAAAASPLTEDTPDSLIASGPDGAAAAKKLEVRALRRTYIRVVRDQRSSHPVFSGYASPQAEPIVVQGKRFWLKVSDRRAVEVREDGQLVRGKTPDIVIN